MEWCYESRRPNRLDRGGLFVMIDILNDIEILEQAVIAFKEGASDEKNIALASLEKLLAEKKAIMVAFEKEMAPKEPFQRWK